MSTFTQIIHVFLGRKYEYITATAKRQQIILVNQWELKKYDRLKRFWFK